jgi:peptidoglycan/LPS O-acetylase OafA/YrhL
MGPSVWVAYHRLPRTERHNLLATRKFSVTTNTSVPGTVKAAGALVSLEGLAGIAFAVILLTAGSSGPGRNIYGEAGYFVVIFGGVLACGVGLWLGKRWARGPAIAMQILLLGVSYYAIGPSSQPLLGGPVAVLAVVVLVLLLRAPSRAWADGVAEEEAK